jgi:murein peptide amidase A
MRAALLVAVALVVAGSATAGRRDEIGRRTVMLGRSADGRPVRAIEIGDLDSPRKALVVGCIHGTECAGIAVADTLAAKTPPPEVDLWILPDLNPDGHAAGTRQNAHGVDLNRNFPWRWRPLTGVHDSGRAPLSEPESRLAVRLVERVRPAVSIWFHQHLNVVDASTGSAAIELRFARAAGMQLKALPKEPGSAVTWETHCYPAATSFVVELPAGRVDRTTARRLAGAVAVALRSPPERRPRAAKSCAPTG